MKRVNRRLSDIKFPVFSKHFIQRVEEPHQIPPGKKQVHYVP